VDVQSTKRQLAAIGAAVAAAEIGGIAIWLRGGWAMDFFLGEVTRPHLDVDLFCWADDADRLALALAGCGFAPDPRVQNELGRDYFYGDVEVQVHTLGRDADGHVIVPFGPHAGERWPDNMLNHPAARLGALRCPIISPAAQIEIKTMMPVWVPGLPVREKDQQDIARLRAALSRTLEDHNTAGVRASMPQRWCR
jgi:aminoglycoside-2''-adenylyltransferase